MTDFHLALARTAESRQERRKQVELDIALLCAAQKGEGTCDHDQEPGIRCMFSFHPQNDLDTNSED
jgi:hypothetical protein